MKAIPTDPIKYAKWLKDLRATYEQWHNTLEKHLTVTQVSADSGNADSGAVSSIGQTSCAARSAPDARGSWKEMGGGLESLPTYTTAVNDLWIEGE